ncbi:hypothetical protein IQ268_13035 [Oculatella sp. LEGE 06141]|uniref:hypothetical protein n=1 Tax=Oculatella sp. LEGE 06141 TaxID=1828648 RepID=UPI0018817FAA|nr:hypothetical protein [Oculatella sp. LEGE 06141]MBE9179488.1 hypothetical protein [Oculatella sp. LEGE 06141]
MTKPTPDRPTTHRTKSRSGESVRLSYQESFICPVCRHGQITGLTLMDAFACNFCRHIFTANLPEQTVQVVDSSQPMAWRWNGQNWTVAYRDELNLTALVWMVGSALVVLPAAIVWLSSHVFPPLPDSNWAWFPTVWVACTFTFHLLLVGWLLVEHYQLPLYVTGKIWIRGLFGQR